MIDPKGNLETKIAFKEKLTQDLKDRIIGFEKRVKFNRKKSIFQHVITAILGAIVTILAGLNIKSVEEITRISILILSSIVTVVGIYQAFFNNKELWVSNTQTLNRLRKLESEFEYYITKKNDTNLDFNDLESFRLRMQEVLDEANNNWESLRLKS